MKQAEVSKKPVGSLIDLNFEAEKIFRALARKNPSVEDVKKITYMVNRKARQNARISG